MIEINLNGRFTYINLKENKKWNSWKKWEELSEEEKKKVNLGQFSEKYVVLDIDLKTNNDEKILKEYKKIKEKILSRGIKNFISDRSPHGFHIFIPFKNLPDLKEETRKEVRKIFIEEYNADVAKASSSGVISLPGRPHFKTNKTYDIIDNFKGDNVLSKGIINAAISRINLKKSKIKENKKLFEKNFKNYFEKDNFFNYIKNNKIPDGTNRDTIIFPNLAIAAVKSGKTKEKIDEILKPIIKNNFPGKNYAEFEGWYKKALNQEINEYNPILINNWIKENTDLKQIYDLAPITVEDLQKEEDDDNKFKFYWDKDLGDLENIQTDWLIESWLPVGDICFVAGKSASYKTTACVHMAYAISEGKLVFNKYKTKKNKVLYLNEENSRNIMFNVINRVKNGLEVDKKTDNIAFSVLENIKLDKIDDLKQVIKFINDNNIKVLICDSFRRFIGFDENNATEMNTLFNNLKAIRRLCPNITILILHHLKKENGKYNSDIRDMLRGSSDIVNSADSIIGITRKHGAKCFKIFHVKNRSGEEMGNKIVKIDGDKEDKAYFYETEEQADKSLALKAEEVCANRLLKYVEENKLKSFKRSELTTIEEEFSKDVLTKALRILVNEGTLIRVGKGPNTSYQILN